MQLRLASTLHLKGINLEAQILTITKQEFKKITLALGTTKVNYLGGDNT